MRKTILVFLILSACASSLGYRKAGDGGLRPGYSDSKLTATTFRVSYLADGETKSYQGMIKRAAEIAKQNGYNYFSVSDQSSVVNLYLNQTSGTVTLKKTPDQTSLVASEILAKQD